MPLLNLTTRGTNVTSSKTIHSRSNKEIGDVVEGEWEITAKKVIAEPVPGDGNRHAPRFGIYEYEVKAIISRAPDKPVRAKQSNEPNTGGTRREASSVPLTVRRTS
jgi:hypothetical protein